MHPQPGTAVRVDALPNRPMYRLAYRNFGSHQALAFNHTVDGDGANRAGVRWYGSRKTTGNWAIQNQGTFARPMVSSAGCGCCRDGSGRQPRRRLADRQRHCAELPERCLCGTASATDPPNQLSQGEAMLHAGTGSQTGTAYRWGDYSMMTTDPVDDCTFWYTQEYVQDDRRGQLAHADRELQVPELRPGGVTASTATSAAATACPAAATACPAATTVSTSPATSASTTATSASATTTSDGALPRAAWVIGLPARSIGANPQGELLCRPHPARSLAPRGPRDRAVGRWPGAVRRRGFPVNLVVGRRR